MSEHTQLSPLSNHPKSSSSNSSKKKKIGVVLCGGGITGAMYEVGCLAALEEAFDNFQSDELDVVIGASSGSTVATVMAGGISAQRLYRAMLDPSDDFFPLQRQHLLRFDGGEMKRMWGSALNAFRRLASTFALNPLKVGVWTEIDRFFDSLPAGFFTTDAFEKFLVDFIRRRGIPETFEEMPTHLVLVANDLDAGKRAIFGKGFIEDVPIAKAVAASTATPVLYAPVRIGDRDYIAGGLGETGHVDLAVDLGCELVIVINAMVPIEVDSAQNNIPTGHGQKNRIRDKGLLWVYNQSWRMLAEGRLAKGIDNYRTLHPETDVLLFEPEKDDATMFMYSPMNFDARRTILEDGYTSTMKSLKTSGSPIRVAMETAGLQFELKE